MIEHVSIRPFAAYFPPEDRVSDVIAQADIQIPEVMERINPHSILHVTHPEPDRPNRDMSEPEMYELLSRSSSHNLARHLDNGVLIKHDEECYYVMGMASDSSDLVLGLVTLLSCKQYEEGLIVVHERTITRVEDSLSAFIREGRANTSGVTCLWDSAENEALLLYLREKSQGPAARRGVVASHHGDNVQFALWVLGEHENANVEAFFTNIDRLYLADGHHRTAAAHRVWSLRGSRPDDPSAWFMAVVCASEHTHVVGWSWVIKDVDYFLDKLDLFRVTEIARESARADPGAYVMLWDGCWFRLEFAGDARGRTDLQLLFEEVLRPIFGVEDPRRCSRLHFVSGTAGIDGVEAAVVDDRTVAFMISPLLPRDMIRIARAGELMLPKATCFDPKPPLGLIVRRFGD